MRSEATAGLNTISALVTSELKRFGLIALVPISFFNATNKLLYYSNSNSRDSLRPSQMVLLMVLGLTLFLKNCDKDFDINLFWRPKTGKVRARK